MVLLLHYLENKKYSTKELISSFISEVEQVNYFRKVFAQNNVFHII